VRLTVKGRVDSVVAVYRLDRSKLLPLGCALTDTSGVAGLAFDAQRGLSYLIAVAAPAVSQNGRSSSGNTSTPTSPVPRG